MFSGNKLFGIPVMPVIKLVTSEHSQMVDITSEVSALIPGGFGSGLCCIFSKHTTAGITVNENADPDVRSDILGFLEKKIPWNNADFHHMEGNSAAHIKAMLTGFSLVVPVEKGRLNLGTWQGIYFCEFDGPRNRSVSVSFTPV
jgi:secondary thiamine-phosphate synthase enzyme